MKKIGKRSIWISIVVASMLLTGCGNQTGSGDRATGSDAVESVPSTTEVAEEATTEATLEVVVDEGSKPEAVPATTEIGGGKKKAEETTEEKKPNTTESTKPSTNHSNNGGSTSSGQSTAPKPSNNGNSGNSGSGNSGSSGSGNSGNSNSTPSQKPSTPATTEAPAAQHQHNYNVWVKTKDAWDEEVIDQAAYDETIEHPAEYKTVPAMKCHGCGGLFTSADAYFSHPCGDDYGFTDTTDKIKVKDAWTETKHHDEKSHVVHHDEEGYWACSCGARK